MIDSRHYKVLEFLAGNPAGVPKKDFPEGIVSLFDSRKILPGGFYYELDTVLKSANKWVETRSDQPVYWITVSGVKAYEEYKKLKQFAGNTPETKMEALSLQVGLLQKEMATYRSLQNKLLRQEWWLIAAVIAAVAALLVGILK
jgi:hypothetical protein